MVIIKYKINHVNYSVYQIRVGNRARKARASHFANRETQLLSQRNKNDAASAAGSIRKCYRVLFSNLWDLTARQIFQYWKVTHSWHRVHHAEAGVETGVTRCILHINSYV